MTQSSTTQDTSLEGIFRDAIAPAYALLPAWMKSREATAELLAIGLQESRFKFRAQKIAGRPYIKGPARGFWQFEAAGGVRDVMTRRKREALALAFACNVEWNERAIHASLETDDVLAAGFARLLLSLDAAPLPALNCDPQEAWDYYVRNWRPGKPHRHTWDEFRARAVGACLIGDA